MAVSLNACKARARTFPRIWRVPSVYTTYTENSSFRKRPHTLVLHVWIYAPLTPHVTGVGQSQGCTSQEKTLPDGNRRNENHQPEEKGAVMTNSFSCRETDERRRTTLPQVTSDIYLSAFLEVLFLLRLRFRGVFFGHCERETRRWARRWTERTRPFLKTLG